MHGPPLDSVLERFDTAVCPEFRPFVRTSGRFRNSLVVEDEAGNVVARIMLTGRRQATYVTSLSRFDLDFRRVPQDHPRSRSLVDYCVGWSVKHWAMSMALPFIVRRQSKGVDGNR